MRDLQHFLILLRCGEQRQPCRVCSQTLSFIWQRNRHCFQTSGACSGDVNEVTNGETKCDFQKNRVLSLDKWGNRHFFIILILYDLSLFVELYECASPRPAFKILSTAATELCSDSKTLIGFVLCSLYMRHFSQFAYFVYIMLLVNVLLTCSR